jgi:type IV secretory pathway VirB10-like protein
LDSTRTAPLSKCEIKAVWEIPAILDQSLNSDLPGDPKALVTSNVYDTARACICSTFSAAFAISQRTNQGAYPTPGHAPRQAVGQKLSHAGLQITRRNLNVQSTVKIPAD